MSLCVYMSVHVHALRARFCYCVHVGNSDGESTKCSLQVTSQLFTSRKKLGRYQLTNPTLITEGPSSGVHLS